MTRGYLLPAISITTVQASVRMSSWPFTISSRWRKYEQMPIMLTAIDE